VPDVRIYSNALLRVLRDDGAVVYLNGTEIFRSNMPNGAIAASTPANTAVAGSDEDRFFSTNVPVHLLMTGTNTLAVEIHQSEPTSSDLSFDLELVGALDRPLLEIEPKPAQVTVSWPFPSSGYRVELASSLTPLPWTPISASVTLTNGRKTLTIPSTGASRFFRLALPEP
jgi:hypothetical protein